MKNETVKQVEEYEEAFTEAIRIWGADAQVRQLMEEASELAVAASHYLRGKASWVDVVGEISDVMVAFGTVAELFPKDWDDLFDDITEEKADAFIARVNLALRQEHTLKNGGTVPPELSR